jgi:predicted phage terminase large subunit-like protein
MMIYAIVARDGKIDPDEVPRCTLSRLVRQLQKGLSAAGGSRLATNRRPREPLPTLEWGRKYLAAHFVKPPSAMHLWLGDRLSEMLTHRGRKVNLIGPRGGAKSTIGTLCHVLQAAVEGWEPYIWIISDTKQQAQTHLENVRTELVDNHRLAAEYPDVAGRGLLWQSTAIELRNGVVIESYGTGQRIRGRRRRTNRPTLIVCDDLQNDSHIMSALQREATRRWFNGTLLKAGTTVTNVVNLATALHRDALALELHRAPGWTSALFAAIESWPTDIELWREWEEIYTGGGREGRESVERRAESEEGSLRPPLSALRSPQSSARAFFERNRQAMEAGASVLWPEAEDLYALMQMRLESGHTAFEREKQGSPVDPELCEWPESYFEDHIWFGSWAEVGLRIEGAESPEQRAQSRENSLRSSLSALRSTLVIKVIALDPSKGQDARRGDYSAYVMLGIDPAGVIYVEADLARRPTPQMVADGAAWCRRFQPLTFGVEANQYQELLAGEFAAEFERQQIGSIVPAAIHNYVNKQVRIRRLGPYLSQHRLRFLANSASTELLVDQLRDFPAGAHDDGPDALEMALRLAEEVWHGRNADDGLGDRLV